MKRLPRILLISNYINLFGFALFMPLYALFARDVGATPFETGIAYGLYTGLAGVLMILIGRIEDHIKRKLHLIVFAYFWLACAALLFLFVDDPTSLYIVQGVNAIGAGMLMPAWKASFAKHQDKGKEASEWSLFDGGNYIGIAIAATIGGYVVKMYGFDTIFIAMFVIQCIAAIISLRLLTVTPRSR